MKPTKDDETLSFSQRKRQRSTDQTDQNKKSKRPNKRSVYAVAIPINHDVETNSIYPDHTMMEAFVKEYCKYYAYARHLNVQSQKEYWQCKFRLNSKHSADEVTIIIKNTFKIENISINSKLSQCDRNHMFKEFSAVVRNSSYLYPGEKVYINEENAEPAQYCKLKADEDLKNICIAAGRILIIAAFLTPIVCNHRKRYSKIEQYIKSNINHQTVEAVNYIEKVPVNMQHEIAKMVINAFDEEDIIKKIATAIELTPARIKANARLKRILEVMQIDDDNEDKDNEN